MKRVIIESPYRGHGESEGEIARRTQINVEYARKCVRDSVLRGEAPIASHLLFTQPGILRDDVVDERRLGIEAGLAWCEVSNYSVFYTDLGWSSGMYGALIRLAALGNNISPFYIRYFKSSVLPNVSQLPHPRFLDLIQANTSQCQS